jgi:hypothetical protein
VNSYHAELEADLIDKGIDLLDFWRCRINLRRMRVLIDGLPTTSRMWTAAAQHDVAWSQTDYLLADLIDIQAKAVFKDPKPYPRPGERETAARALSARVARAQSRQKTRGGTT